MRSLEQFKINLKALTEDDTPLEYELDDDFFALLESDIVQGGSLHVSGSIRKTSGFFKLQLHSVGAVCIPCDRCLDLMEQPVEADLNLVVKLGSKYTEDDDLVTVDETDPVLSTAWFIYESVVLAVPIQHVHQLGGCNDAMMRMLNEHSAARSSDADAKKTDPRWDALRELQIDG